jgi:hypothetical protein
MAIDGTWTLKLQTPMGERPVTVRLAAAGDSLTGAMMGTAGETAIFDSSTDGTAVKWSVMFTGAMGEMKLDFAGAVNADAIAGTVQFGGFGTGTFDGSRA